MLTHPNLKVCDRSETPPEQQSYNIQNNHGKIHVLLVDDDASLRRLICEFLISQGFHVLEAEDGNMMRRILGEQVVNVIILDIMMPNEDGLSIARSLSNRHDLGIIMISALGTEVDRIVGLEVGADDYLAKPVSPRELVARLRALHRRLTSVTPQAGVTNEYSFAGWRLDPVHRILRDPQGVVTTLSEGEFTLLLAMVERPQRVLSRDELLDVCRGATCETFDRAIDSQVSRLRRKLGMRVRDEIIRTVRNGGYIFLPDVSRA